MSFPRYPKYKASGVEWLGDVPEHWNLPKLKGLASFSGGGTPARENLSYWNGEIPWVSPKDMKTERILGAEESITKEGLKSSAANLLPPGRVLMVVRSGILKHTIPVAINETDVAMNQDMKALSFDARVCVGRFFQRWVQGLNDRLLLVWAKQGATVESIEHSYLADTVIPLPSVPEQLAIAACLDRETAKIDELVEAQARLIELLKEKRQAVISHAVTKGLNPHAPMKPSGVEWLGEVPEHWEVPALSYRYRVELGKMLDAKQIAGTHLCPYVRNADVQWGRINIVDLNMMDFEPEERARFVLRRGDLLVCEGGEVGRCAVWDAPIAECYYQKALHRLRAVDAARDEVLFLRWLLEAATASGCFAASEAKATIAHLPAEVFRRHRFAFPPLPEQLAIVAFLDRETARIDTLTTEAQRAIDLLRERRSALISAAVTGQIDVRNAVTLEVA